MSKSYNDTMRASSHLSGSNASFVDALYEDYLQDPQSVLAEWQAYFKSLPAGSDIAHGEIRDYFRATARYKQAVPVMAGDAAGALKQAHVLKYIEAYRTFGHHQADLDPLMMAERKRIPELDLNYHQLSSADANTVFTTESKLTNGPAPLKTIEAVLKATYCGSIGIEYAHISDHDQIAFIQTYLESQRGEYKFSADDKRRMLKHLTAAEGLEKYLGTRFVGQKRFSLEGGDSLIPMMKFMLDKLGDYNVKETVIGMAHRGRLNVLVNILGKAPEELFSEFEGRKQSDTSGDVKYHMGFSSDIQTSGGPMHLTLSFNPSHLAIITPVVQGSVRSRQCRRDDLEAREKVVPVVIHGDAAFAGQGVIMEAMSFSQARGYTTGGTIHIVVNNQVGFTTSHPLDARSTLYCTDIAKMVQAPVIHVNGEDVEACVAAIQLATDYRMKFKRDVVIDLVCYRRHGHNEADEPAITQPNMYKNIRSMPTTRDKYGQALINQNLCEESQVKAMFDDYRAALDHGDPVVETITNEQRENYLVDWRPFLNKSWRESANMTISLDKLTALAERMNHVPENFNIHPVVKKLQDDRIKMAAGEIPCNWGFAENLAYATLVTEGYAVRLSGQDCGRGTFAHRHAKLHDAKNGEVYIPLTQMAADQGLFVVIDSILSEEAVLGFEYGYASTEPNALVIWEAQFGDFANGAQVVIDQFISSGEQKWGRLSGLTMLLPHGYEGQGPEHSSARLERFMQLCAQQNIQVCVPSTPAQIFHLLRRQMLRPYRKPLIIMSPKSLLRHKRAVSDLSELTTGEFQLVIPEHEKIKARKVVLCSGKVYYELLAEREEKKINDIAIVRLEQLYPFPLEEITAELAKYKTAKTIVWCQEEPKNQGAWYHSAHNIEACLGKDQKLVYAGRDDLASPASGYPKVHKTLQQRLIDEALS